MQYAFFLRNSYGINKKKIYFKFNNKKKNFFQTNWFFEKTPFLKNLKTFIVIAPSMTQILIYKPVIYNYIIKVRTQKLREISTK